MIERPGTLLRWFVDEAADWLGYAPEEDEEGRLEQYCDLPGPVYEWPWSGIFVMHVAHEIGIAGRVYAHAWPHLQMDAFVRHGRFGDEPRVGAVVFYNFRATDSAEDDGIADSCGIVERVDDEGRVWAIVGDCRNGLNKFAEVQRRCWLGATVLGFGYPDLDCEDLFTEDDEPGKIGS